ncbi:hypothetical protein Ssi03_25420 [Sphaerisporangium siamense]|uniref:Uncharacterized protein n=1 Tax=Sphaerisporangium siamense TaxID=795645 RepID=A0A7W7G714_9ACTN|nr:hypothetical protein [Sphaerisporangium siamense]MBB4700133.1 hypothetical protein [Sphaerisporangium siamense]GII84552.1 hypothetical protein Ssi03_25420 [Sphaerisporangium siamense]
MAPAWRTFWLYFPEGPVYETRGFVCPLAAEPYTFHEFEWLVEINWRTISAELNGWPSAVMAVGLSAVLALPRRWGTIAGWVTAALFGVIAVVFTSPYAVRVVSDRCVDTLHFGGWDIIEAGPIMHYLSGAVLVVFLSLFRRGETEHCAAVNGAVRPAGWGA